MKGRLLCAAMLILPAIAAAGVNPRNGNFFITYRDIGQESGGRELNLVRTYNAKASGVGWFGYGWGSVYETNLRVMVDGTVVVKENGFGQINHYVPEGGGDLQAGVDRIVAVAVERERLDAAAAETLRGILLADEELRRSTVEKMGLQSELPAGSVAKSTACAAATVTRIKDEYRRTPCGDGSIEYFDLAGRLVRQEEGNYKITFHYGAGERPDRIEDTLGQKLFLEWTPEGRVAKARSGGDSPTIVTYRYDKNADLVFANTIGGNFYRYAYDARHNMTRIGYIDNTHMDMQYDERDMITSVAETDGSKTLYHYRDDPADPGVHFWTTITSIDAAGARTSQQNEYWTSTDANGIERTGRVLMSSGGHTKDVVKDEQGRVKRINKAGGGFLEYAYHPTLGKVVAVSTEDGRTDFRYNEAGDLIRVENSRGRLVELDYGSDRTISRIVETDQAKGVRRELLFSYNALKKPVSIRLVGVGEMNVEYDDGGNISAVASNQGAAMAMRVEQVMSALLETVKIGGIDLGL